MSNPPVYRQCNITGYALTDPGPWRYRLLSEPALTAEFTRLVKTENVLGSACVCLQPNRQPSEDRHAIRDLHLPLGNWRFAGVFDGHAGKETVDYTVSAFPTFLQRSLSAAFANIDKDSFSPQFVSKALAQAVVDFDNSIMNDFVGLFPGGLDGLAKLSDSEIEAIVNDSASGGKNNIKVLRCMRGSTLLVSLLDPSRENLWVASLGDCQAALGSKGSTGVWHSTLLSSNHNGVDAAETDRINKEHPGEAACVENDRVLGAIAPTRVIGDHTFKLPVPYTRRVFLNTIPGFYDTSKVLNMIGRSKTPPYLSNIPDVRHVDLKALNSTDQFLLMCSDGLVDMYMDGPQDAAFFERVVESWVRIVGDKIGKGGSGSGLEAPALSLMRDALGGADEDKVSRMLTVETPEKCMDDITLLLQRI
ncbi:hypothetical protein SERLA73DRAFT_87888 [Serpula lacrymans var. lacrymans S7.3]|uniref:PPM-type phosphatase domain-containing protein n=2 Tax=Serpula lacrymans var. lacrymans TaxID=341189 RepID=F8PSI9_SERL3|nr:uncharacterized protein SERLADRAFT_464637 [Serpula lacrymans var. lacrymans S7.9]EGO01319.1 hypothetical protein SERLA73DRAFT_87888 [Serpula lacrymans var. lacrymans S7.3]EGO26958.1 hypothetical protein SERLADRAFT_464637 [Serpula lacrymans var. lacrymans S7.9]